MLLFSFFSLKAARDAPFAAIRIELNRDLVPNEDFDPVEPHFACQICKDSIARLKGDPEERVWECLIDNPLYFLICGIHS